tara:strand:+ start:5409 stop:6809 length:1401 start_codon:yes stop_codon:yes gene_type:complete
VLRLLSNQLTSNCEGFSRREFLHVGALSLGGLTLPGMLRAASEVGNRGIVRDKAVVMLNLQGGPSQHETFDPKMDAPSDIRSVFGEIPTSLPGVRFGSDLKRLAKLADRMAIVRSYRHGIGSHGPAAYHVAAGGNATGACMGTLFANAAGLTNSSTGMPNNTLITARSMGEEYKELYASPDRVSQTGSLSESFKSFDPGNGGTLLDDMKLNVPSGRLDDRTSLLGELDKLRHHVDGRIENASTFDQQAIDIVLRGVGDAFDLSKEDSRTVARYDTAHITPSAGVMSRNSYAKMFSPVTLGKQMLMARRLVEAGCGFVTVTCGGWDMHGGGKEYTIRDGIPVQTAAVDTAASAFIEDIIDRGLFEKVLLVITGEFGRTPKINKNGGRDHWGNLCPLVFVGGGLKMGQAIGESDRQGGSPVSSPVSSSNLLGTIMHTLLDIGELRTRTGIAPDALSAITDGHPIAQLV